MPTCTKLFISLYLVLLGSLATAGELGIPPDVPGGGPNPTTVVDAQAYLIDKIDDAVNAPDKTVWLEPGVYPVLTPISITSNTYRGINFKCTTAASGGRAIIAGGAVIPPASIRALAITDPWYSQIPSAARANIKVVDLAALGLSASGNTALEYATRKPSWVQAFWGESRMRVASEVSGKWRYITSASGAGISDNTVQFKCTDAGLVFPSWHSGLRVQVFPFSYKDAWVGVQAGGLDGTNKVVTVTDSPTGTAFQGTADNKWNRWMLWNAPEWLDAAGEYVVDFDNDVLYMYPPSTTAAPLVVSQDLGQAVMTWDLGGGAWDGVSVGYSYNKALRIGKNGETGVTFRRGKWIGNQDYSIELIRLANSQILSSLFVDCEGGGILVNDERGTTTNYTSTTYNSFTYAIAAAWTNGTSAGNLIHGNTFQRMGIRASFSAIGIDIGYSIYNIGWQISGNRFDNLGGRAINVTGIKIDISGNTFSNCVNQVSDLGAVYVAGAIDNGSLAIRNNTFSNVLHWAERGLVEGQAAVAAADNTNGSGYTSAIMVDDFGSGVLVTRNAISNVNCGMIANGGRGNIYSDNRVTNARAKTLAAVGSAKVLNYRIAVFECLRQAMLANSKRFDSGIWGHHGASLQTLSDFLASNAGQYSRAGWYDTSTLTGSPSVIVQNWTLKSAPSITLPSGFTDGVAPNISQLPKISARVP